MTAFVSVNRPILSTVSASLMPKTWQRTAWSREAGGALYSRSRLFAAADWLQLSSRERNFSARRIEPRPGRGVAPTDLPSNHSYHHGKLEQLETALRSSLPIIHSTNSNCPLCPGCSPLCGLLDELDATSPQVQKANNPREEETRSRPEAPSRSEQTARRLVHPQVRAQTQDIHVQRPPSRAGRLQAHGPAGRETRPLGLLPEAGNPHGDTGRDDQTWPGLDGGRAEEEELGGFARAMVGLLQGEEHAEHGERGVEEE